MPRSWRRKFEPLKNRLAFSYDEPLADGGHRGPRDIASTQAPFQNSAGGLPIRAARRDVHLSGHGRCICRQTASSNAGASIDLDISLAPVTYDRFLDVGFTRGFASSQAFRDKFPKGTNLDVVGKTIIPDDADAGLGFQKAKEPKDIYDWLGFEAYDLIASFLKDVVADRTVTLDVFAYDLNEPDIVGQLERLGKRLRVIIDDSAKKKNGVITGHGAADSAESESAKRLRASAGEGNVHRTHFRHLQHTRS
jgi:hypothetical protein